MSRPSGSRGPAYDAAVIGAGHNGLVTANYLARAGLRTLVLEARDVVGGAALTEELHPGFRVDTAAHRLGPLDRRMVADLGLERAGLRTVEADPTVVAPQPDGRRLQLWRDPLAAAESIRVFSRRDADRWPEFIAHMNRAAAILATLHGLTPPRVAGANALGTWGLLKLGGALRHHRRRDLVELLRLLPMSVAELLDEWFESQALKGALAAAGITGIFQGPMGAGTAYLWLRGLSGRDTSARPAGWAMGGIGTLASALADAARGAGAELRTEAPVVRILVEEGTATGVVLASGEEIRARFVASSADPARTYLGLVDPQELDPDFVRQVRNIKFRGACAKVNLALRELPDFGDGTGAAPQPAAAISISPDVDYLERAYDDAKYGQVSRQPYLDALLPSVLDPSLAPTGSHVMSVLVQYTPYRLRDGEWDDARCEALGDAVIELLGRYAPNLESSVLARQVLTPADLEARFGLTEGNIHHGELTLDQLFFMRPVAGWSSYRAPIRNLYMCGAGAHPGGGLTGTPGYNAARQLLGDTKRGA